jgi:dynein heavy chain
VVPCLQVRVPKEETGMVSDLRYGWRKLRKLATDTSDNLAQQQVRASGSERCW